MLNKNFAKPPKRKTAQQWAEEQLAAGNVYAFDYTPEQLEMMKKAGKAPTFYDPRKFKKQGTGFTPLEGVTETDPNIVWGGNQPTPNIVKKSEPKPMPVEGRKPMEFGPYQNFDPNTGKYYDPTSGKEITPSVEGKAKGGLVKKYGLGGAVTMAGKAGEEAAKSVAGQSGGGLMGAGAQGVASGLAGPASALGTTAATAIEAGNTANEFGEVNEGKSALAGGLKYASTAAPIALNPALLAATGGLSALAIPVAGGIGAIVSARKAGEENEKAVAEFKKQKLADETAKSDSQIQAAIRQRELGYSKGGKIVGKGTGTSDGIAAKVGAGSFIVPAKNAEIAEEIREKVLRKAPSKKANLNQGGGVEVKLSNGEHMFDENEAKEIEIELGPEIFKMLAPESEEVDDDYNELADSPTGEMASGGKVSKAKAREILKDGTAHGKPLTDKQKRYFGWLSQGGMKCGGKVKGYAKGGSVEKNDPRDKYAAARLNEEMKGNQKKLAGTKSAPPKRKKVEIDPITDVEELSLRELEGVGKKSYNEMALDMINAETAAKTAGAPTGAVTKTISETVTPTSAAVANRTTPATQSGATPSWQNGLTQVLGYGIPAVQTAVGASALSKLGKRPVDKLDPEYLASIQQAKDRALQAEKEAQFGMTAEEKFLLGQENQGLLNQARAAARNYSGGSGSTAFQQERMGIQDAYGRGLLTKVRDNALKLQKQGIAADRAAYADQLIAGKTDMNRRLFADQLRAWEQNQMAAGDLTSQGLTNLMSQNRYNQFLQNRDAYQ